MKSGRLRNMVLLIIGASIINLFCSSMVVATITWLDNLWAPQWNNNTDIEKFKKELEQNLDLKELAKLLLEREFESLEERLEEIQIAKYLRQFLLGYGEEGRMLQYVELVDNTLLIRWPVPIARTKEVNRRVKEELKFARNEVDEIFRNLIGIEPYKGIIPIWIDYRDDKEITGSSRTAGITIGGALILLYLPGIKNMDKNGIWQLPGHEIKSLIETAKHEIIHFYVNRRLGYRRAKKLPRDFHEGLATSLINQSIRKVAEVKTVFTDINSYVRTTKIIEAPEEYKRYHLQMKYLRQKYGDALFYTFVKKVLSGDNIDQTVKDIFGSSSWKDLFPSDLALWMVQKEIGLKTLYIFLSALVGVMLLIILWYLGMSSSRRYIVSALLRRKSLMSDIKPVLDIFSGIRERSFLRPRNIILISVILLGALVFDIYRRWSFTLNIDAPLKTLSTLVYFDWIVGTGVIVSAMAILPINFLFLRKLNKETEEFKKDILRRYSSRSVVDELNRFFLFNRYLLLLKRLEPTFKFFPAFSGIVNSGKEIKSILERLLLEEMSQKVSSHLSRGLFEDAYSTYVDYLKYVDYLDRIEGGLLGTYKAEINKIAENIVRDAFERAISLVDSGQVEEAEELSELIKIIVEKERIGEDLKRLVSEIDRRIWAFLRKTVHEE